MTSHLGMTSCCCCSAEAKGMDARIVVPVPIVLLGCKAP